MSTSSRLTLSLISLALVASAMGCSKEKEEPVVMALPSAAPVAPAKAVEDAPAQPTQPAGGTIAPTDTAAAAATPAAPATDAPKAAAPQPIDGCCSALAAMAKDAKLDAVTKSKATAAAGMCNVTAPLVKSGKGSRATALTQIRGAMAGSAPAACN
jgi:hypothetical protein